MVNWLYATGYTTSGRKIYPILDTIDTISECRLLFYVNNGPTTSLILTCQIFFERKAIEVVFSCSEEGEEREASGSP